MCGTKFDYTTWAIWSHWQMAHKNSPVQPAESIMIRTKLNRPRQAGDLVPRPRLLTRLECNPQPSAWLSLNEEDSDPAVFLSYFIAAIRTVFPDACPSTGMLLCAPRSPPLNHIATALINELLERSQNPILTTDSRSAGPTLGRLSGRLVHLGQRRARSDRDDPV